MSDDGKKPWCGKHRHNTKAEALAAAVSAKNNNGRKSRRNGLKSKDHYRGTGAKISVYRCQICGFFHWGHRVKGSKHSSKQKPRRY